MVVLSGTATEDVIAVVQRRHTGSRADTREQVEDVAVVAEQAAVVSFAVIDPVVARTAEHTLAAHRAVDDDVVARAAEVLDAVVAAEQEVFPAAADENVPAESGPTRDRVVAWAALHHVVAVAA